MFLPPFISDKKYHDGGTSIIHSYLLRNQCVKRKNCTAGHSDTAYQCISNKCRNDDQPCTLCLIQYAFTYLQALTYRTLLTGAFMNTFFRYIKCGESHEKKHYGRKDQGQEFYILIPHLLPFFCNHRIHRKKPSSWDSV